MAIRDSLGGRALPDWPTDLLRRDPRRLRRRREGTGATRSDCTQFGQFLFDRQWPALKHFANERSVKIIGDVPIFVALDSADVWANPDQFLLDADRKPTVVAGVPPDYFSADGQHWGNPIYDWAAMEQTGYAWWVARMRRAVAAGRSHPARPLPRLRAGVAHPGRREDRPRRASGWTARG